MVNLNACSKFSRISHVKIFYAYTRETSEQLYFF